MSRERFRQRSIMTKEYYLDSPLLETCRFATNVESIQHKSLARIVASTRPDKVKHKQRRLVQVAALQILARRNGVSSATDRCSDNRSGTIYLD